MRGSDQHTGWLFSSVNLDERIPRRHPLRKIKSILDAALASLDADLEQLYAGEGRPSIAPERLLRASLVQILFSIRCERQLMEQLQYNLLLGWFVGLSIDEPVWVATVFTKNRDRLLNTEMAQKLLAAILAHENIAPLLSDDHFSVDGTLVEAWASFNSFRPKSSVCEAPPPGDDPPPDKEDGAGGGETSGADEMKQTAPTQAADDSDSSIGRNVERNWRGAAWSNATHASVRIPMPGFTARPRPSRRNSRTWAMRSPRTGTASWSRPNSRTRTAPPSGPPPSP